MNKQPRRVCRYSLIVVGCVVAAAASSSAHASFWDNLWKTPHQQNSQQEQAGNFEALTSEGAPPEWAGVGHYRSGDFAAAAEQFGVSDDVASQYNRATSLTQAGQFEEALELFDDVLKTDPDHEKAAKNRDIARQLKELQQQQQEQQQQDGEQGDEGEQNNEDQQQDQQDNGDKQDGEQQESQQDSGEEQEQQAGDQSSEEQAAKEQNEAAESESDQEAGEEKEAEEQAATAEELIESMTENEQATEQWLRRIPDDPTGLLRRKLQRSHSTDFPGVGDSASPW